MKPFNLKEALQGKPVRLRNGLKAIIYYDIPENFKLIDGVPITYPLKGMTLDTNGMVISSSEDWLRNGRYSDGSYNHNLDIIGMWDDVHNIIKKAYQKNLPLKTRNNTKVFISTIIENTNELTEQYSVFGYSTTTDCYRWTLDGKFLTSENDLDIVSLWEEDTEEED